MKTTNLLAILATCLCGCSTYQGVARPMEPEDLRDAGWFAVTDVPFVAQADSNDCGCAALAMVLQYWGKEASAAGVAAQCGLEPGKGAMAGDLRSVARETGLRAFVLSGFLPDLVRELRRGRPVVVGLVKPHATGALAHYEVVIGLHADKLQIATLDPGSGVRNYSFEGFLQEWQAAGYVTLVIFPPADKTATPAQAMALGEKK